MKNKIEKAVVLLSGGLDSTTCIALANEQKFELYALTVNYGQKHNFEIEAAKCIAKEYNVITLYKTPTIEKKIIRWETWKRYSQLKDLDGCVACSQLEFLF